MISEAHVKITGDSVTPQLAVHTRLSVTDNPSAVEDQRPDLPLQFTLHQNYPNPFSPESTIRYDMPKENEVSLVVYDLLGREVVRLVDRPMAAGYHSVIWNGRDDRGREVPAGIYIARLIAPEYIRSIKLVLLK